MVKLKNPFKRTSKEVKTDQPQLEEEEGGYDVMISLKVAEDTTAFARVIKEKLKGLNVFLCTGKRVL